jgi:uncharacterized membrane protein (UPF0127 family)
MNRIAVALIVCVTAGCNASKPPPRPPEPPGNGTTFSVAASDPLRRVPALNRLSMWNRDRHLHFFAADRPFDVAFLDASGRVVETGHVRDEVGITSKSEVRHALVQSGLKAGQEVPLPAAEIAPMPVVKVGGHDVHVETSHQVSQRQRGLMHRPRMSKDDGMLFLYSHEDERSFWMKNTLIALDIAYFADDGRLINVCRMKPAPDPSEGGDLKAPSGAPARFVLEVNYGWFDARGLIDAEGKPAKPVRMELPESLRRMADEAD